MDRRWFLRAAGGTGIAGVSGAAGWAIRDARVLPEENEEGQDATGLASGRAGAFGVHRLIYSVPVDEPLVALTFDDGPDPQFTPKVLETLAKYDIKATFNVMGYNALHHGDILQETVAAGHEIGNHTWTHLDLSTIDARETAYEIHRGREVIEDATGLKIRFFRPPRGEMNGAAVRLVAEAGNDILMWSITGSVPGRDSTAEVNSFVLDHLQPGAIIDYHDGIGRGTFSPHDAWAKDLVKRRSAEVGGLGRMIETAMDRGYRFLRVSDLLDHEVPGQAPSNVASDEEGDADDGTPKIANPPDATIPGGDS